MGRGKASAGLLRVAGLLALTASAAGAAEPTAHAGDTFGDWIYECATAGGGAQLCSLSQTLVDQTSKKALLKFSLGRDTKSGTAVLVALLPLGLDLPSGVSGAVDQKPPFAYVLQTCVAAACVAIAPVDAALLADFKAGTALSISFTMRGESQPRTFAGSLKGMTAGATAAGM